MQSSWAGSTKEDVPRGFFLRRVLHLKREIRVSRDAVLSVPDGVADQRKRTLSMSSIKRDVKKKLLLRPERESDARDPAPQCFPGEV